MASTSSAGNGKIVSVQSKNNDTFNATDDDNRILGGNGNDVLTGGAGADHIYGGAGDDTILGGGGKDDLKGDSGNDTLDGGAGSDEVEGGSGNDVAIYVMSENVGSHDEYDGGAGVDTLRLVLTRDEWMRQDVQSDVARYLTFLAANTNPSGQATGHEFQFTAFGLEATKFEKLEVMVDGQMLDPRDQAADAIDDAATATEDGSVSGNVLANDNVPDLVRSVEVVTGPAQGQLTFNANGSYTYVPGPYFNALAEGETATQSFTYRVTDADGDTDMATVTITITGTNDGPVAQADTAGGTENQALVIDVLANDSDVDHGAVLHVAAASVAAGQGSVTINADNTLAFDPGSDFDHLAQGASATVTITYTVSDEHGAQDTKTVAITVTGTNDAPVMDVLSDAGAVQEDTVTSATGQLTATDVDDGAALAWSVQGTGAGAYGTLSVDQHGQWTYQLANNGAQAQALAEGETATEIFTVQVADEHGATVTHTVSINVTGTNDAPIIASGATAGAVTEDGVSVATGQLAATDADHGAHRFWSVQGGTPSGNADFHFAMDSITIVRNNAVLFQDNFSDGIAPPLGPNGTTLGYTGIGSAVMTESGGRLHLDSDGAVSFIGVSNPDPVVGVNAIVRTNIDPASTQGLKSSENFTVTGVFDLILPDSPRENYGIRLTDRVVGGNGTPPDQLGDNVVEMRVTENASGTLGVRLRQLSFVDDTVTTLQSIALAPPPGADQIRLNLTHSNAHVGEVTGTFEYLHAGSVVGTQAFSALGHIFQGENFVRAELIASAPAVNDSIMGGTYGNLTIDQTGTWTYTLDNTKATTQALAEGQHASDTFTVQVADEHGATDTRVINVDVTGTNDAPIMQTAAVARALGEDASVTSGNLTATGDGQFADVDVTDTHAMTAALVSAVLSNGAPLPSGLAAALTDAVSVTLLDPATGDGHGQYRWDFALDNALAQSLGAGQTLNISYNVTATDSHGAAATQQVNIAIAGANDAPVAVNDTNALTVTSLASQVHTNFVNWVDWTSSTGSGGGSPGTVTGVINLGNGQTIGVTYTGEYQFVQTNGGTNYYNLQNGTVPVGTYTSAAVADGPNGSSDIIALSQATQKTLTFSQPVDDLFFAIVSLNGNGYQFDQDFQIASYGPGYWGTTSSVSKVALPDGRFEVVTPLSQPNELHGVLQIQGTVQSLTWTSLTPENWNGFTVGTYGKAQTATATGNLLANDSDPDTGDTIVVSAVNGHAITGNYVTLDLDSGARVTVNKDGTYLYDENSAFASLGQNATTQDSFSYTVSDNHGVTSTATATITVTGINDGPVAVNDGFAANEDTALTVTAASLLANDTDVDIGDVKTLLSVQGATHGTVSLVGDNVIFTPDVNYNGSATFGYTMRDLAGATSSATVNVTVNPVTDTYTLSNLVTNGSFEQGTSGWTQTGDGVDVVNQSGWQSGDGVYSLDLNAFHPGGVQQVLQTTPGLQYTVGFDLSKNPGNQDHATVLVSANNASLTSQSYTFSDANTGADMKWSQQVFSFTATGNSTTLSFASTYPTDAFSFPFNAEGPALDEVVVVSNKTIDSFAKGAGGDVLQLHDVLSSVNAPHDGTAFTGGYLRFAESGSDTLVQLDANGGGDSFLTLATLSNTLLTQSDTANYTL